MNKNTYIPVGILVLPKEHQNEAIRENGDVGSVDPAPRLNGQKDPPAKQGAIVLGAIANHRLPGSKCSESRRKPPFRAV